MEIEVLRGVKAADDRETLRRLGAIAIARGWARQGYVEALLEREAAYPTGIATASARVALAHADPVWVQHPALLVAVLAEPVLFHSMEEPSVTIPVDTVFLMLIDRPEAHLALLGQLVNLVQSSRFPDMRSGLTASELKDTLERKEV